MLSFNSYGMFEKTVCVFTDAQERNNLIYLPNKTKPFSGNNLCKYNNGQYKHKGKFKNGMEDGKHTYWHENGQIGREAIYINGNPIDGPYARYDSEGRPSLEANYKNGKLDGLVTHSFEGRHLLTLVYKNGKCVKGQCSAGSP